MSILNLLAGFSGSVLIQDKVPTNEVAIGFRAGADLEALNIDNLDALARAKVEAGKLELTANGQVDVAALERGDFQPGSEIDVNARAGFEVKPGIVAFGEVDTNGRLPVAGGSMADGFRQGDLGGGQLSRAYSLGPDMIVGTVGGTYQPIDQLRVEAGFFAAENPEGGNPQVGAFFNGTVVRPLGEDTIVTFRPSMAAVGEAGDEWRDRVKGLSILANVEGSVEQHVGHLRFQGTVAGSMNGITGRGYGQAELEAMFATNGFDLGVYGTYGGASNAKRDEPLMTAFSHVNNPTLTGGALAGFGASENEAGLRAELGGQVRSVRGGPVEGAGMVTLGGKF